MFFLFRRLIATVLTAYSVIVQQIKIIRILTVIAYLISVSAVAATLSAYYVFIWNPHAGNRTDLPNAEGIVMALQRARNDYVFANAADRGYSGKKKKTNNTLYAPPNRVIYKHVCSDFVFFVIREFDLFFIARTMWNTNKAGESMSLEKIMTAEVKFRTRAIFIFLRLASMILIWIRN